MPFCHIDPLNFSLRKQKTAKELNLDNAKLENTSSIKQSTLSDSHLFIDPTPLKLLLPGPEPGAPPAFCASMSQMYPTSCQRRDNVSQM